MLALALAVTAAVGCKRKTVVESGDEVFATAEDAVLQVTLVGPGERVTARRSSPSHRFEYTFERGGKKRRCGPSKKRDEAVQRTFSVRAVSVFDEERTDTLLELPEGKWIQLEVRGVGDAIEPFRLEVLPPSESASRPRADAVMRPFKSAFSVDPQLLDLLAQDCS